MSGPGRMVLCSMPPLAQLYSSTLILCTHQIVATIPVELALTSPALHLLVERTLEIFCLLVSCIIVFIASHFYIILYDPFLDTESESSSTVFVIGGIVLAALLITSVAVAVVAVILTVKNYCRNAFVNKSDR